MGSFPAGDHAYPMLSVLSSRWPWQGMLGLVAQPWDTDLSLFSFLQSSFSDAPHLVPDLP